MDRTEALGWTGQMGAAGRTHSRQRCTEQCFLLASFWGLCPTQGQRGECPSHGATGLPRAADCQRKAQRIHSGHGGPGPWDGHGGCPEWG